MHVKVKLWRHTSIYSVVAKCTCLLNPRSTVLLQKLTGSQLVKKFPAFYGNRRFITAFTTARRLSLSSAWSIQSTPTFHFLKLLILSFNPCPGLPSGIFPSGFPTKTLYVPLLSLILATCPANLTLLGLITRVIFGEEYWSLRSSLCSVSYVYIPWSSPQQPLSQAWHRSSPGYHEIRDSYLHIRQHYHMLHSNMITIETDN